MWSFASECQVEVEDEGQGSSGLHDYWKETIFTRHGVAKLQIVNQLPKFSAEIEVDVPASVAYDYFSDRESFPRWMPFISTVKVFKDKPELSRWTLKYTILGRDVESSWIARNLQPIRNQKIHWRSLEGFPNRGAVRFYPKGSSSCKVELKISYEVPQIFAPVASALKPITRRLLQQGLEQFAVATKSYVSRVS